MSGTNTMVCSPCPDCRSCECSKDDLADYDDEEGRTAWLDAAASCVERQLRAARLIIDTGERLSAIKDSEIAALASRALAAEAKVAELEALNNQRAGTLTRCRLLAEHWQGRGGPASGVFAKDLLNVLNGHGARGCGHTLREE